MNKSKNSIVKFFLILFTVVFLVLICREMAYAIKYAPDYSSRYLSTMEYINDRTNLIPGKTYFSYVKAWLSESINRDVIYKFFIGNFCFGIPIGIILSFFLPKFRTLCKICSIGLVILLIKELLQVGLMIGSFDIDSLILSSLGIACGYLIFQKFLAHYV